MGVSACSGHDFYVTQEGHPNYLKTAHFEVF